MVLDQTARWCVKSVCVSLDTRCVQHVSVPTSPKMQEEEEASNNDQTITITILNDDNDVRSMYTRGNRVVKYFFHQDSQYHSDWT
mmetsp:Transcript_18980/g.28874  ORF Transcript_18980/g.28874 Transcript_18980/m.28874 type:complete len:85 (+) Transcript_18980:420-674(+)